MPRVLRLCALLALLPASASAQSAVALGDPIAQSDLLYLSNDPGAAYEMLREHVARHPDDYEALWRTARAGVVVGIALEDNRAQNVYLDPALDFARHAVEVRPDGLDGLYWRGVAAGRRAMNASPRYAVELAQIVYDDAHAILEKDSLHAGAHNMLGKLNFEVMTLSRFQRAFAKLFLSNDALAHSSWAEAEAHLAKAVEVSPDFVLFQFDLGQLLERRGRDAEARAHLEEAVRLPAVQPIDPGLQEKAAALLEELGH